MSTTETVTKTRGRPKAIRNLTVEEIVDQGASALREIVEAEAQPGKLYEHLADLLVALRMRFQAPGRDGMPDWAGRSGEFKAARTALYSAVEVPPDSQDGIQARIRYHVGKKLREVAPAAELEAVGLKSIGPAESAVERRKTEKAAGFGKVKIENRADVYRACRNAIEAIVPTLPIPQSGDPDYVECMQELVELTTLCEQLWATQEQRRSDLRNRMHLLTTYQLTRTAKPQTAEELTEIRRKAAEEARILSGHHTPALEAINPPTVAAAAA